MATKKFTDLTALTAAATDDVLPIDDTSASTTKQITVANLMASIPANTITPTMLSTGATVQMAYTTSSTVATGTTTIPHDNTIPQNTEGTQFMTLSITPQSATNILVIEAVVYASYSVAAYLIAALFQDSTVNALAIGEIYVDAATGSVTIPVKHVMVAGTTSSTTFKVRCGGTNAGTLTFNGTGGASIFSTVTKSSMTITEYKA